MNRQVKRRSIALIYLFSILTFGFYFIYWLVATKRDINSAGGDIPTTWVCLIPFVGIWWSYKYCDNFAKHVKKDTNGILYFLLFTFVGFVAPIIVQGPINEKLARA